MPSSPGRPDYIRFFATTDDSALARAGLEYAKALCRIAPVRLITLSGTLMGPWRAFGELMGTPMMGAGISAVATDPSRWVWAMEVPMPEQENGAQQILASDDLGHLGAKESVRGTAELYTVGQRNILFPIASPRDSRQLEAAEKYESIVVPSESHSAWWSRCSVKETIIVPQPVTGAYHDVLKRAVLG